jgi:outer membrane protein TolC
LPAVLTADAVVAAVLERNPTLAEMAAAAEAAAARYPQVTSLEDPTVLGWTAPGSVGSSSVDYAARVEVAQRFPFPGKLGLRGESARADAGAAAWEVEDARLALAEAARSAFADLFLAERTLIVYAEDERVLREYRRNAETRYRTGQGPQQDVLQADVELGRRRERQIALNRARAVARARLNTLMHLPADAPLPGAPETLPAAGALPDIAAVRDAALAARPDLRAAADRAAREEAEVALALREFCPDFEAMAAYDGFWQGSDRPLQGQVGLRVNLPVRRDRRWGAVGEAKARLARRRAEYARLVDRAAYEIHEAGERARESADVVRLYEESLLPAAEANVKEARSAYVTGKVPFVSLAEAQRALVSLRERYYEAQAEGVRRRAALERAAGGAWR